MGFKAGFKKVVDKVRTAFKKKPKTVGEKIKQIGSSAAKKAKDAANSPKTRAAGKYLAAAGAGAGALYGASKLRKKKDKKK
jgi:16S rRNA A1518/A1519 N6-dimethyltransferase RsmA/KsgA/DIM1 with predicted DNA glycosylase/AP lyase activity